MIGLRISKKDSEAVECLIKNGKYKSVSQIARIALADFLSKHLEASEPYLSAEKCHSCSCNNPKTPEIKKVREAQAVKAKATQTLTIPTLQGGNAT